MAALIGEPAVQRAMGVVKLVGCDPIVLPERVVVEVVKELRERIDVLACSIGEERHRIMFDGVVVLGGAVVGIDRAVGPRGVVGRAQAQLNVFLVILPRNACGVELGRDVRRVENIVIIGPGFSIGVKGRYSTERATKPQGKTALARRVAALLACGFVARRVTERCGYALLLAPRHKPKSPATNCVLSYGLVSISRCARVDSLLAYPRLRSTIPLWRMRMVRMERRTQHC